jgi:hypothetical protein
VTRAPLVETLADTRKLSSKRFIARLRYKANHRVADIYVKLQYGGVFGLVETMARAWAMDEIDWFRIDTIKPGEITPEIRAGLVRWPEALAITRVRTKADFNV